MSNYDLTRGQIAMRAFRRTLAATGKSVTAWEDAANAVIATESVRLIFRAGDDEPDGVRAVVDTRGVLWQRGYTRGWVSEDEWFQWWTLLDSFGPLVEVVLPAPVTE